MHTERKNLYISNETSDMRACMFMYIHIHTNDVYHIT